MESGQVNWVPNCEQKIAIYQNLEKGYLVYVTAHQQISFSMLKTDFVS